MANIDLAVARIRNQALRHPFGQRAAYIADNIRHQQDTIRKFTTGRAPAGWSLSASEELLHRLVVEEAKFADAERAAA